MPKTKSRYNFSYARGALAKSVTRRGISLVGRAAVYQQPTIDVEPPAAVPVNVEKEKEGWLGMDVEEPSNAAEGMNVEAPTTIVAKKYVQPATLLPEGYIAPALTSALVMHGESLNTNFLLPPHLEVVIFSRRGQVLIDTIIAKLLVWINKDFHTISKSSLQEYHLKRIVEKNCSQRTLLLKEIGCRVLQQNYPHYTRSKRFKPYKSYFTATLQIFRGGQECPDISLENDKIGKRGIGGLNGFWDFRPLSRNERDSDTFIDNFLPYPSLIKLSELLPVLFPDRNKPTRLYLFCCRVEHVGKEASRSSNHSRSSSLNLD